MGLYRPTYRDKVPINREQRRHDVIGTAMIRTTLVTTLVALLVVLTGSSEPAQLRRGNSVLQLDIDSATTVKFTVRVVPYSREAFPSGASLAWWGAKDGANPRSLIASIDVRFGMETVAMPMSAISGLGNPVDAELHKRADGVDLIIRGGDASTAYEAVLSFADGRLNRRKVRHGAFPDQVWEETVYSYNVD